MQQQEIFQILPNELIGEIICGHIHHVELIFSLRNVCRYWRGICHELIWDHYQETILNLNKSCKQVEDLDDFLDSKEGRKFTKYLLRKQVYELACKLSIIGSGDGEGNKQIIAMKEKWVDEELRILKGYFERYSDLQESPNIAIVKPQQQPSSKGFFGGALSFIGSFFSSNTQSNSQSNSQSNAQSNSQSITSNVVNSATPTQNLPPPTHDYLTKVLLDGDSGSGKTSLLNCSMNGLVVEQNGAYYPSIGVDFAIKMFHFGDTTRVKLQLWDQCGPERYRSISMSFYRGAATVLLLLDPNSYKEYAIKSLEERLKSIKKHAPKAEIIFITTKKDKNHERCMSNEQADQFAFDNFGGMHLDITNTQLEEPKRIICYSALLKYLLSSNISP
ncbi:small GTPase [Naegleria gruberi]|uniref:Small GTPase n=1 Tax=Naegleria gruberi TaxID=5762 RepID=D2VWR7_NAEGR|nr:small GTPase [Naegleria gruberi]EFC38669.1 small GTPase [Naegleria gruberi]|eukprot:XP_002671413.1 small GTPase [Naegleria gruberi]